MQLFAALFLYIGTRATYFCIIQIFYWGKKCVILHLVPPPDIENDNSSRHAPKYHICCLAQDLYSSFNETPRNYCDLILVVSVPVVLRDAFRFCLCFLFSFSMLVLVSSHFSPRAFHRKRKRRSWEKK